MASGLAALQNACVDHAKVSAALVSQIAAHVVLLDAACGFMPELCSLAQRLATAGLPSTAPAPSSEAVRRQQELSASMKGSLKSHFHPAVVRTRAASLLARLAVDQGATTAQFLGKVCERSRIHIVCNTHFGLCAGCKCCA